MYRYFLLLIILLVVTTNLFAQHTSFTLRNYTAVHGLPQSQVNSIAEDSNGYLWMGTFGGGLARFDGQDFKVYTTLDGLLSNIVTHVAIDSHENLWIVHPRGITRYDGVTFKTFQAPGELSNLKMIRKAFVFQDTVFITSAPGLLGKIYKDSVYYWNKEYAAGKLVQRVHQLQNGKLCIFLNDGKIILKTPKGDQVFEGFPNTSKVFSVYNHGESMRLLVHSTVDESVITYTLNEAENKLDSIQSPVKMPVLLYDGSTKTYWIRDDATLLAVREDQSIAETVLKDVMANEVLPDSEGNIWIGTNGGGLFKYFHRDFSKCSSENMRGVMTILKDGEKATWIGTMAKGLWKIKSGKINSYMDQTDSYRNGINCVAESPDGTIWMGTSGGLGKYDKVKDTFSWFTPKEGLSGNSVFNICFNEKGHAWIGTSTGLNYFDGNKFSQFKTEQGLLTNTVNSSYYSMKLKTLFVGNEFGINTITNGKIRTLPIRGFENTTILSIQPYQDSLLLFGSGGAGFAVYDPVRSTSHFITTRQGLISDFIYFIASDDTNTIWVGTEKGISRIILNDKFEIVENLHFDNENGLEGVETNQNAFYLSSNKKFFGLIDGLYEFNDLKGKVYHSFGLHLTNVEILYGQEPSREFADRLFGFFKLPETPVFPSDKNHITFSFNRVDKRYPKSVRFKYMLKDYDKAWSIPSSNKQVTYSNLPPGNYEFLAMSTNSQGSWSDTPLRYPFTVKAPFYQTATFGIIAFLVLLGAIIFIAYMRVRQRVEKAMMLERIRAQEQESLRKEIARDFHDEMGNQLTRIINYVSLLKLNGSVNGNGNGQTHSTSNLDDLYTKVENSAKYLYTGTRDFIWSIDPVNDELSKLFIHIRDFGEKLFEEKDIQFRANNGIKEKIRLPYGFSREVNLIFKEAMTNTFKYSEARNATLSLQRVGSGYEIYFEDDGVGFNASDIEKLNGLKNIRERADKIHAVLRIRSRDGEGTRISLGFQFTKTPNYGITV
jgi:signal transduction histidine kinase/ligand-binding sensor domain-containing protein